MAASRGSDDDQTKPSVQQKKRPGGFIHGVAGFGAGLGSMVLLYPLDVMKTRLQVQSRMGGDHAYRGTIHAVYSIFKQEGVRGFYQGLTPSLAGSGIAWGVYFYFYDHLKRLGKKQGEKQGRMPLWESFGAATLAGVGTAFVTNPIFVIKTRMQIQRRNAFMDGNVPYHSILDAVRRMYREEGPLALYKGLVPSLWATLHGGVQFMLYEELKHLMLTSKKKESTSFLREHETFLIGAVSKIGATLATYPLQVVRTRLQDQRGFAMHMGLWTMCFHIFKSEGIRGLYRGLAPNLMRVTPMSAITLTLYELLVKMLGRCVKNEK